MTPETRIRRFIEDRSGASAAEFAMVFLIFCVIVFGIIDFSRALWQWNMAEKAAQMGVRLAVVSNMVPADLMTWDGVVDGGNTVGDPVALGGTFADAIVCTNSGCSGQWGYDSAAFNRILTRVQGLYAAVQPENLVIEYRHIGLGIAGNPLGPDVDPAVTVRLTGLDFDFITPGLSGVLSIPMPDFQSTLTAEDSTDTPT